MNGQVLPIWNTAEKWRDQNLQQAITGAAALDEQARRPWSRDVAGFERPGVYAGYGKAGIRLGNRNSIWFRDVIFLPLF